MMEFYGLAHPNARAGGRWRDPKQIRCVVLHVAVIRPATDSALAVARWQSRQQGSASGYHTLFDSHNVIRYFPDDRVAHGARHGFNRFSVHLSWACNTDTWERDPDWAERALVQAAPEVWRLHQVYGIPLRLISRDAALGGERGFIFHSDIDPGRRTDPGPGFPAEHLFSLARSLNLQEDDMRQMFLFANERDGRVWLCILPDLTRRWVPGPNAVRHFERAGAAPLTHVPPDVIEAYVEVRG